MQRPVYVSTTREGRALNTVGILIVNKSHVFNGNEYHSEVLLSKPKAFLPPLPLLAHLAACHLAPPAPIGPFISVRPHPGRFVLPGCLHESGRCCCECAALTRLSPARLLLCARGAVALRRGRARPGENHHQRTRSLHAETGKAQTWPRSQH